jgi:hypothetical protein
MPTIRRAGERPPARTVVEIWREDSVPASRWRKVPVSVLATGFLLLAGLAGGYALRGADQPEASAPVANRPADLATERTAVFVIVQTQEQALRLEAAMPPVHDPMRSSATRDNWFVVIQAGTQGENDMYTAINPLIESGYTVRIADLRGR